MPTFQHVAPSVEASGVPKYDLAISEKQTGKHRRNCFEPRSACIHYVCIHAYMHTCIHAYIRKCIAAYRYACVDASMHRCIHLGVRTCMCAMRICIGAQVLRCTDTCVDEQMHRFRNARCIYAKIQTCNRCGSGPCLMLQNRRPQKSKTTKPRQKSAQNFMKTS